MVTLYFTAEDAEITENRLKFNPFQNAAKKKIYLQRLPWRNAVAGIKKTPEWKKLEQDRKADHRSGDYKAGKSAANELEPDPDKPEPKKVMSKIFSRVTIDLRKNLNVQKMNIEHRMLN